MPEICRFYGIVIKMYFADHAPPHFHAEYSEHEGVDSPARAPSAMGSGEQVGATRPSRPIAVVSGAVASVTGLLLTHTSLNPAF